MLYIFIRSSNAALNVVCSGKNKCGVGDCCTRELYCQGVADEDDVIDEGALSGGLAADDSGGSSGGGRGVRRHGAGAGAGADGVDAGEFFRTLHQPKLFLSPQQDTPHCRCPPASDPCSLLRFLSFAIHLSLSICCT